MTATVLQAAERRRKLGKFLKDRRDRLRPQDVGLAHGSRRRRVAGLRREEVADLAGVGVSWYTMLESGTATGVSAATLHAVARALRLDADEIMYVTRLAEERAVDRPRDEMSAGTHRLLSAIEWAPAYVITSQWIVLAWNRAMSLVWDIEDPGGEPFNIVRRTFEDPAFRTMHGDEFAMVAQRIVAMVRAATASRLEDPEYVEMCESLRADPVFAQAWETYEVRTPLGNFTTTVRSRALGPFAYEALTLDIPGDDGHWLVVQTPDEPSALRLREVLEQATLSVSGAL